MFCHKHGSREIVKLCSVNKYKILFTFLPGNVCFLEYYYLSILLQCFFLQCNARNSELFCDYKLTLVKFQKNYLFNLFLLTVKKIWLKYQMKSKFILLSFDWFLIYIILLTYKSKIKVIVFVLLSISWDILN